MKKFTDVVFWIVVIVIAIPFIVSLVGLGTWMVIDVWKDVFDAVGE